MSKHYLLAALMLAVPANSSSAAESETVTIPLKNIWGYHRVLRGLEPELFIKRDTPEKVAEYSTPEKLQEIKDKAEASLTLPIERAMQSFALNQGESSSPSDWMPSPGFAVVGSERKALREVHDVVVKGKKPSAQFRTTDNISIVFFALRVRGLRLYHVERAGNAISIYYGLLQTHDMTSHWNLSLIPVGELPAGTYEVAYVRSREIEKSEQKKGDLKELGNRHADDQSKIICKDFKFTVTEEP